MITPTVYNVEFPKMGIKLKINPVALSLGNLNIYWYGIIVALGFILGFSYVKKRCQSFGFTEEEIEKITVITSFVAIACARIYYVIFYPGDFYIKNPSKIFLVSEGGIAIYGAIIGGFFTLVVLSVIYKKNLGNLLDLISPGVLIGQFIGRWGNFINQEAFGTPTNGFFGMKGENTFGITVHPCFLYESAGCLACFVFLHIYSLKIKHKPGEIFLLYIFIYGLMRTFIEGLRTDSLLIPFTCVKVSQLVSIILALVSLIVFCIKRQKSTFKKT